MILKNQDKQQGFTLVEIAIVLVIFGLVLSVVLLPLSAQREQAAQAQTINTLDNARQALLGFAQTYGRLPCPATALTKIDTGSRGLENPLGGTHKDVPPLTPTCVTSTGYLPAATLGLQPADVNGFALDAWSNRIRYAVSASDNSTVIINGAACGGDTAPDFTTANNMTSVGLVCLAPELKVCNDSSAANCSNSTFLIKNAVAVIYSTGANGGLLNSEVGADEVANKNASTLFYSRTQTAQGSTAGEFDDLVTWISPYVLYNAMIQAGQLH